MDKKELIKTIARLETINDQLLAELHFLDELTKQIGFQNGLTTLKQAAAELLLEQQQDSTSQEDPPIAN